MGALLLQALPFLLPLTARLQWTLVPKNRLSALLRLLHGELRMLERRLDSLFFLITGLVLALHPPYLNLQGLDLLLQLLLPCLVLLPTLDLRLHLLLQLLQIRICLYIQTQWRQALAQAPHALLLLGLQAGPA